MELSEPQGWTFFNCKNSEKLHCRKGAFRPESVYLIVLEIQNCCQNIENKINRALTKDYVMAAFTDNYTSTSVDFNDVFEQFMEDPIRDTLLS